MSKESYQVIYAISTQNDEDRWNKIGVAFANRDGSLNLVFDTGIAAIDVANTRIHIRKPKPKNTAAEAAATTAPTTADHDDADYSPGYGDIDSLLDEPQRPRHPAHLTF
jgi:hypothetical protein